MKSSIHQQFMARAVELAREAWGETHPNPLVGALVVEDGRIVAEACHARAGEAHAEKLALQNLGRPPSQEACLYVTLEPCSTVGKTPACSELLIRSGLKNIVIGAIDPNPNHAGRAIDLLLEAGLDVTSGVLANECEDLNLIFNHWITKNTPLIAGKIATTIDGKIATRTGQSQWITGHESRQDVMQWRRYFPAIAVGAETAIQDDPRLTSRYQQEHEWCPLRLVFDRTLRSVDANLQIYSDRYRQKTIVVTSETPDESRSLKLKQAGVDMWPIFNGDSSQFWQRFRECCYRSNIQGVFVEGGSRLLSDLFKRKELDYLFAYRAPLLFCDDDSYSSFTGNDLRLLQHAPRLKHVQHSQFADDQLMRGFVVYPQN